ncbi:unnamed protein product [Brassica rapa]|uniref:Uncharacterized protein n=2 Tax=Brassica TaxID=3705 RepID=A0A3P5ZUH7_BRACM|nr:unnamed protein product [Brassica napus]CAG7884817.1 unnamed protein product [Brassica rapa]CDY13398.1 BnaA03g51160D [Brassica napus]VDC83867.1 unnamed protein product [Brassica rapa]
MPTFRMNPNLELQEFTQPLLKTRRRFTQPPSHLSSLLIKIFSTRLKPKEKSVVIVVGKTFDQLVSNCPDNVHLKVSKTKRSLC